jgi:predicted metal-dependent phosphoesterase TrpH
VRIDLHTHSAASDGTLAPAQLMSAARAAGLDVVALTDHDSTAGWDEAVAALPPGLTLVPGCELSCRVEEDGKVISLHLLAYLFDRDEPALAQARARVRASRQQRAAAVVERLRAGGYDISYDRVREIAGDGTLGRPHVARAMVELGIVPDLGTAFTADWIATRGRYWVGKDETDVFAAVDMVRAAGGVSVFAHPFAARRGVIVSSSTIAALAAAGLDGVEVDHPDHSPAERDALRDLAAELGLVVTGASDFHGSGRPHRLGSHTTSTGAYAALVGRAHGRPVAAGQQAAGAKT